MNNFATAPVVPMFNEEIVAQESFYTRNQKMIQGAAIGAATVTALVLLIKGIGYLATPKAVRKLKELQAAERAGMKSVLKWMSHGKNPITVEKAELEDYQKWSAKHDPEAAVSASLFRKTINICAELESEKEEEKEEKKSGKDKDL